MQALTLLIRSLCAVLLFTAVLELLIPPGALSPFVRWVLGLLVLLMVLTPLLQWLYRGDENAWLEQEYSSPDYAAQGQALGESLEQQAELLWEAEQEQAEQSNP